MFWILFAAVGMIASSGQWSLGLAQLYPPFAAMLARLAYLEHPDLIPTTSDLVEQRWKKIIDVETYHHMMQQAGYTPAISDQIFTAAQSFLSAYDYVGLWRRGLLPDNSLNDHLDRLGFVEAERDNVKNATLYYPTAPDVVQFAVREVFKPEIVAQYGQDQELDPLYIDAAKKAGLSEDFATKYWAAHWQLPSASQGFQMLHYGIIDSETLRKLLATLDYMPFWRDKIEAISYNPISRVDIRRMFQAGMVDRSKVKDTYLREGYRPEDAELITQWVEREYAPKVTTPIAGTGLVVGADKQIYPSESLVIDSYKRGLIGTEVVKNDLRRLGFAPETIDLLIERVDQDIKQEQIDLEADAITDKYRSNVIDINQYKLELTQLGVPSQLLETTIARELAQAKHRVKMPTKADYDKWLKIGLIGVEDYAGNLRILGYRDSDIRLYIAEAVYDLQPKPSSSQPAEG